MTPEELARKSVGRRVILLAETNDDLRSVFVQPAWLNVWTEVWTGSRNELAQSVRPFVKLKAARSVPSLEGDQISLWITEIEQLHASLSDPTWNAIIFEPSRLSSLDTWSSVRPCLVAARSLLPGHVLAETDIVESLQGPGIPSAARHQLYGRRLSYEIAKGELITFGHIQ